MSQAYYTLVASLPWLPPFTQIEHPPLSRKQLDARLKMLSESHAGQLFEAESLVRWQKHPITRTSTDVRAGYRALMERDLEPTLREYIDFRMGQRTAMAAVRAHRQGQAPPDLEEDWGVGPLTRRVRSNWDADDLGLRYVFGWIGEARSAYETGHAVELERILMHASWEKLSTLANAAPFGFEAVFAFAFKLDIVHRWLSFDARSASQRFQTLVDEVTRDHQQLF